MAQVPDTAQVLKENGDVVVTPTKELVIGDIVVVSKGGQIPIDGLIDRNAIVNEAALTGESVPVEKELKEEVLPERLMKEMFSYRSKQDTESNHVFQYYPDG